MKNGRYQGIIPILFNFFILFLSTYNGIVKFSLGVPKYFLENRYLSCPISTCIVSFTDDESILIIPLFPLIFFMI